MTFSLHTQHTVLIVDDEPKMTRLLSLVLSGEDYLIIQKNSSVQALELMRSVRPCVVLLDITMPDLDGISLLRTMRGEPDLRMIDVIFVTGDFTKEAIAEARKLGVADIIRKPFEADETRFRVASVLALHAERQRKDEILGELQAIMVAAQSAILMMDNEGLIRHWNSAAERIFGYTSDEVMGKKLHELLTPPRFQPAHDAAFPEFRFTGKGAAIGKTLELWALRKSGEEFPIEISLSATQVRGQWCSIGIIQDITERRKDKEDLRLSENRLRLILDHVPVGIALVGRERKVRWANQAALQMVKAESLEQLQAVRCNQCICVAETGACPVWDLDLDVINLERVLPRCDGTTIPILKTVHKVELSGEEVLIEAFFDLAGRKALELELTHARKLEAVGQLASGIAHEINTPTQYVSDNVHFLKDCFGSLSKLLGEYKKVLTEQAPDSLERIRVAEDAIDLAFIQSDAPAAFESCLDGIQRISTIVLAMKEFAHPDQREKSPADLNQALRNALIITHNEYKYVADVETEYGELPAIPCLIGELNQVFLNLIVNAAHAIADVVGETGAKGRLRVKTSLEGSRVRIEITDTGAGIPQAIRDRVFDPFFTTKPVGKGTGQGLAIARSIIVDKHAGTLSFESTLGLGTTFMIYLPVSVDETKS